MKPQLVMMARKYIEGKKIRYYHIFEVIYWIVFTKIKIYLIN